MACVQWQCIPNVYPTFKQQLGCRFDIMDRISSFFLYFDICNYICLDKSYNFLALSLLLNYSFFFKYSCTNILHRRRPCTFYEEIWPRTCTAHHLKCFNYHVGQCPAVAVRNTPGSGDDHSRTWRWSVLPEQLVNRSAMLGHQPSKLQLGAVLQVNAAWDPEDQGAGKLGQVAGHISTLHLHLYSMTVIVKTYGSVCTVHNTMVLRKSLFFSHYRLLSHLTGDRYVFIMTDVLILVAHAASKSSWSWPDIEWTSTLTWAVSPMFGERWYIVPRMLCRILHLTLCVDDPIECSHQLQDEYTVKIILPSSPSVTGNVTTTMAGHELHHMAAEVPWPMTPRLVLGRRPIIRATRPPDGQNVATPLIVIQLGTKSPHKYEPPDKEGSTIVL